MSTNGLTHANLIVVGNTVLDAVVKLKPAFQVCLMYQTQIWETLNQIHYASLSRLALAPPADHHGEHEHVLENQTHTKDYTCYKIHNSHLFFLDFYSRN